MRLAELELAVQSHVLAGGPLPAALAASVEAPATERFEIYVEAYRLRLVEALAAQYPALAARLGREAFAAAMRGFIDATPSVHRSIRDYGSELAGHLAARAADDEARMHAELAAFEWRLAAAFDAPPATPTAPADLAGVAPGDWPELRFRGIPSLARLATRSNAVAVWRAAKAALESGTDHTSLTEPVAAHVAPLEWLIYRRGLDTEYRSLAADEAAALDRLLAGNSFGELCASLAERGTAAAASAASWLKGWLTAGILERV